MERKKRAIEEMQEIAERKESNVLSPEVIPAPKELDEIFQKGFLENDIIKFAYGIWVPLDFIQQGGISDLLRNSNTMKNFSLTNPELGPFLDEIQKKLNIKRRPFAQLFNQHNYLKIIQNQLNINIQTLLEFPQNPAIKEVLEKQLTQSDIENYKQRIEKLIFDKSSAISRSGVHIKLNFHPDNLEQVELNGRVYVVLPTSQYEVKGARDEVLQWIRSFKEEHKRAPYYFDLQHRFGGGLIRSFNLYGLTHNDLLTLAEVQLNREKVYDWNNPSTWEKAKNWAWLFYIFGKQGRAPHEKEIRSIFGGIHNYEKLPKILGLKISMKNYNTLLKFWELPISRSIKYNWANPQCIEVVKNWTLLSYIFDGILPTSRQVGYNFGGLQSYLRYKKGMTINDLFSLWNLPVAEKNKQIEEGLSFEKEGQKCLKLIFPNVIKTPWIHHPILKELGREHVIPDGIIHNFKELPLKKINKSIYLEEGQLLDNIIDFKRSIESLQKKDWEIYTKIAKKIDIFLLKGNGCKIKVNNCVITLHPLNEFISLLHKLKEIPDKKTLNSSIKQIYKILRGINPYIMRKSINKQKEINEYE